MQCVSATMQAVLLLDSLQPLPLFIHTSILQQLQDTVPGNISVTLLQQLAEAVRTKTLLSCKV